jgi:hypothetical protein
MTSCRDFLKKGSLVALVAGAPMGLAEKVMAIETRSRTESFGFSEAEFKQQLHTSFLVKDGHRKIPVKLISVDDWRRGDSETDEECFGLRFLGARADRLKQDTYEIEHKSLGSFSLLLVPMGLTNEHPQYEAIINHVIS